MNILITGATGYVGRSFIESEASQYNITALVRKKCLNLHSEVKQVIYDGTIESIKESLENVDLVLHLATKYVAEHQESDVKEIIESNVLFGANLLEAMKQKNVSKIVNIGTTWQMYEGKSSQYANLYASSKQSFQEILKFYTDCYSWQTLNLHLNDTYGENDKRKKIIQLLIESAIDGNKLDMSMGHQRFETCHIVDVISALKISLDLVQEKKDSYFEVFSILTGDDVSLRELADMISEVTGYQLNINWGARPYRNREVMNVPTEAYKILPGWNKSITLNTGISILYDWYKGCNK